MSHAAKILQSMKEGRSYQDIDFIYLGIAPNIAKGILQQLEKSGLLEKVERDGDFSLYKTKQRQLFKK